MLLIINFSRSRWFSRGVKCYGAEFSSKWQFHSLHELHLWDAWIFYRLALWLPSHLWGGGELNALFQKFLVLYFCLGKVKYTQQIVADNFCVLWQFVVGVCGFIVKWGDGGIGVGVVGGYLFGWFEGRDNLINHLDNYMFGLKIVSFPNENKAFHNFSILLN